MIIASILQYHAVFIQRGCGTRTTSANSTVFSPTNEVQKLTIKNEGNYPIHIQYPNNVTVLLLLRIKSARGQHIVIYTTNTFFNSYLLLHYSYLVVVAPIRQVEVIISWTQKRRSAGARDTGIRELSSIPQSSCTYIP